MRKYTELLTIPVAFILLALYNHIAMVAGLHPFTWEEFGAVFVAFLIFLITTGFVRLIHRVLFPVLYRYFDPSFKENRQWHLLNEKERFRYSFYLHCVLLILFGLIVNGI